MRIDQPEKGQLTQLRALWKQAFGDSDAFLDGFFATGFLENRCRCITWNEQVVAALYWFDCVWQDKKLAYIYAVSTEEVFRGKGFCRNLMEDTHRHLQKQGYAGAVLVPGNRALFTMYQGMGYRGFCPSGLEEVTAGEEPAPVRALTAREYAQKREKVLPQGGVIHTQAALSYLSTFAGFFEAEGCLFCGGGEGTFLFQEFFGEREKLPGILAGLQVAAGRVPCPGAGQDSAMFYPLTDSEAIPTYFGLPLN